MREPSPLCQQFHQCASSSLPSTSPKSFTSDQHQLFQTCYAEGFNLPDPDYSAWLAMRHPEKLPSSAADSLVTHVSGCSIEQKTEKMPCQRCLVYQSLRLREGKEDQVSIAKQYLIQIMKACLLLYPNKPTNCKRLLRKKQGRENESKTRKTNNSERKGRHTTNKRRGKVTRGISTSLPDLASMFGDKCVLSGSDTSDAEYTLCGLSF